MPPENKRYRPERHRDYFAEFSSALFPTDTVTIPNSKGSYALIFSLKGETQQVIGKLGLSCFRSGVYGYAGNAYGGGGLRARLQRHFASGGRTHWHIDYLKSLATLHGAWVFDEGCECDVANAMLSVPGACLSVDGFGASDCKRCRSHLVLLEER